MTSIYFIVECLMFIAAFFIDKMSYKTNRKFFAVICVIWTVLFGLRAYCVGNDTVGYADFFMGKDSFYGNLEENPDVEIGFLFFVRILRLFTTSPTVLFSVLAVWLFILVYKIYVLVTKQPTYLYSLLIFFTISNCFGTLMVATRQTLAFCVFLTGLYLILKNNTTNRVKSKTYLGLFIIVLSIVCHKSLAFLLIIMLLAYYVRLTKKKIYVLLAVSFVISFFCSEMIGDFFNQVLMFAGASGVNGIDKDVMLSYASDFGDFKQNFITLLAWVVPVVLTTYLSSNDCIDNFFFRLMIFSVSIFLLFNTTFLIERINTILILLGFTQYYPNISNKKVRRVKYIYFLIAFVFLIKAGLRYDNWPKEDSTVPYYFFWEK